MLKFIEDGAQAEEVQYKRVQQTSSRTKTSRDPDYHNEIPFEAILKPSRVMSKDCKELSEMTVHGDNLLLSHYAIINICRGAL